MSRRCTIVRNDVLDRLLAIERQARVLVGWWDGDADDRAAEIFEELARLLGPRKE